MNKIKNSILVLILLFTTFSVVQAQSTDITYGIIISDLHTAWITNELIIIGILLGIMFIFLFVFITQKVDPHYLFGGIIWRFKNITRIFASKKNKEMWTPNPNSEKLKQKQELIKQIHKDPEAFLENEGLMDD